MSKSKKTLAYHMIDLGVSRADELLATVRFEGTLPVKTKCVVSGRPAVFALSVTVETVTERGAIRVFPLSHLTVGEWTESLRTGRVEKGTGEKIAKLDEQLARAVLSVEAAKTKEKVRLARRKTAIKITEREREETKAAEKRIGKSLQEADRWRKAHEQAISIARREVADPEARERTLQRRFTRPQADVLRLYFAVPEAAKDKDLTETVIGIFAARHFTSHGQQKYVQCRVLEIRNTGLLGKDAEQKCETCGSEARLRYGFKGAFWGCTSYPKCRWTRDAKAEVNEAKIESATQAPPSEKKPW